MPNNKIRNTGFCQRALAGAVVAAAVATGQAAVAQSATPIVLNIPAQGLAQALNDLARQAGLQLLVAPDLVAGRMAPAVQGRLAPETALQLLLAGSGLEANRQPGGALVLRRTSDAGPAADLPVVRARASTLAVSGEPPKVYAGGQVAQGARLGMLGNTDLMSTPFSIKSYTHELIQNQGARSVDDVVANDPSIRVSLSPGFVLDQSSIRGFVIFGGAYTLDGLPGMVSYSRIPVRNFERVEVFKGPSSALGGASVSGTAVGGSINLVPKRAQVQPNNSVSIAAASDALLETHLDVGQRFGDDKAWGLRVNVFAEDGELSTKTRRQNLAPQIALDYASERLRASLDAALIDYKNRRPGVNHSLAAGQAVPRAPDPHRSANPENSQQALEAHYGIAGLEFDLLPQLTAYAKYGKYHEESVDSFVPSVGPLQGNGSFTISNFVYNTWKTDHKTRELGLRAMFDTGPVKHQLAVSALHFHRLYTIPSTGQSTPPAGSFTPVTGNIYTDYLVTNPFNNVAPAVGPYTGTPVVQQSVGLADNMSLLDGQLSITAALRRQKIESGTYRGERSTPTLAAAYQLGAGWMVYGNYAEQLSQGAVAPAGSANAGESLAPYVGKQNEFGAKWHAGRYGVTLAYFDIRQASAFTDPADKLFKAAGEQRNKGLELETFGELRRGLRLLGGLALIDAKQSRTRLGATDGKRALGVAELNLNLGAEWDVADLPGLTLTGRVIHTGNAYLDLANTQQLPAWTRVDLGARYAMSLAGKPLSLRAGINNLFDKSYWQAGGRNLFVVAEPRNWRLSATLGF